MCIVCQAVQCRVCNDLIIKEADPLRHVSVAGDNGGSALVPFADYFIEVMSLLRGKSFQAEVVDYQQAWGNQFEKFPVQRVIGAGGVENLEHFCRLDHNDILVTAAGGVCHGVGKEGFPDADRTGKNNIFFALHPVKANESLESVAIKSYLCFPIEALQHLIVVNLGRQQAPGKRPLIPPLHLIREEHLHKFKMGKFVSLGVGYPFRQGGQ